MLTLRETSTIPDGFLTLAHPSQLHTLVAEPTLLHLEGRRKQPLFVSILLHGNEDTGFFALQQLLQKYQAETLPRSLSIYFGNVSAARENLRRLEGQPDYNRTWPGSTLPECAETRLMADITARISARQPFASIDIHNNTGLNPHYGCINVLTPQALHLARLFSRTIVYFEVPTGVQSMAMAQHCPAVTIECGKSQLQHGIDHALEYLDAVLSLAELPSHPLPAQDVDVFHTVARVLIPESCSFSFSRSDVDIHLSRDIERYNFAELQPGAEFAKVRCGAVFQVQDDHNQDRFETFFRSAEGRILLNAEVMPSMLTLDETVIRQDCFCYLMERLSAQQLGAAVA